MKPFSDYFPVVPGFWPDSGESCPFTIQSCFRFQRYHALIPATAMMVTAIARDAGLAEKPIVRGTAAISPFGPSSEVSFVLIPIKMRVGVTWYLCRKRRVCERYIRRVEFSDGHKHLPGTRHSPGSAALAAGMQRPQTAGRHRRTARNAGVFFIRIHLTGMLVVDPP